MNCDKKSLKELMLEAKERLGTDEFMRIWKEVDAEDVISSHTVGEYFDSLAGDYSVPDFTTSHRYHTEPVQGSFFDLCYSIYKSDHFLVLMPLKGETSQLTWGAGYSSHASILITPGQFIDALIEFKRKQENNKLANQVIIKKK